MAEITIRKSFHNKKGIDIWLVKLDAKVDYSQFKNFERQVKVAGGYYSNFVKAFVFETEPSEQTLKEIFGGAESIGDVAKTKGVSENLIAKINLNIKNATVRRDVLRDEFLAGKLEVAKSQYFNPMTDSTEYTATKDLVWQDIATADKEIILRTIADTYHSPYAYGDKTITKGSYTFRYKEGIIIPEAPKSIRQKQSNFYIILADPEVDQATQFKTTGSHYRNIDIEVGTRVVLAYYGKKYCGQIIDKKVDSNTWISRAIFGGAEETRNEVSANYTVKLDNGIIVNSTYFDIDTDNSCDEIAPNAIFYDGNFEFPEGVWNKVKTQVSSINRAKASAASRKKAEYKESDLKQAQTSTNALMGMLPLWLAWEVQNMDYARQITGESEEEQSNRLDKWKNEYGIEPKSVELGEVKQDKELAMEKKAEQAKTKEQLEKFIEYKNYPFPTEKTKYYYTIVALERLSGKPVNRVWPIIDNRTMWLAGKGQLKFRQLELAKLTGIAYHTQKDSGVQNLSKAYADWLIKNTNLGDEVFSIDIPIENTEEVVILPEITKESIEKRLRGLQIANKLKPDDKAISTRILNLQMKLNRM
jgi:hypothetical protein